MRFDQLPIALHRLHPEAAKYMHPRMGIQVHMDETSFAGRLERAIERSNKIKNGAGTKLIETKPEPIRRRI
jgi:hypothetical protein